MEQAYSKTTHSFYCVAPNAIVVQLLIGAGLRQVVQGQGGWQGCNFKALAQTCQDITNFLIFFAQGALLVQLPVGARQRQVVQGQGGWQGCNLQALAHPQVETHVKKWPMF